MDATVPHQSSLAALDTSRLPSELAVSVITIGELQAGVLAATNVETRSRRLATLTQALSLEPIPIDERVAAAWAELRIRIRDASAPRIGVDHAWIPATAITLGVPVIPQDEALMGCPGVEVIRV